MNNNKLHGLLRNVLPLFLAAIAGSVSAATDTIVSDKTYACMATAPAAGLLWNGSGWDAKRFNHLAKFILNVMVIEDGTKKQYLHFKMKGDGEDLHCGTEKQFDLMGTGLSCMQLGVSVLFAEKTGQGGISYLLGSTSSDSQRDALVVMPFTCQKF